MATKREKNRDKTSDSPNCIILLLLTVGAAFLFWGIASHEARDGASALPFGYYASFIATLVPCCYAFRRDFKKNGEPAVYRFACFFSFLIVLVVAVLKVQPVPKDFDPELLQDVTFSFNQVGSSNQVGRKISYAYPSGENKKYPTLTKMNLPKNPYGESSSIKSKRWAGNRVGHLQSFMLDHSLVPQRTTASSVEYALFVPGKRKPLLLMQLSAPGAQHAVAFNDTRLVSHLSLQTVETKPLAVALPEADGCELSRVCMTVAMVDALGTPLFNISERTSGDNSVHFQLLEPVLKWKNISPLATELLGVMENHNFWSSMALAAKALLLPTSQKWTKEKLDHWWKVLIASAVMTGCFAASILYGAMSVKAAKNKSEDADEERGLENQLLLQGHQAKEGGAPGPPPASAPPAYAPPHSASGGDGSINGDPPSPSNSFQATES